jgi:hypothetical protein
MGPANLYYRKDLFLNLKERHHKRRKTGFSITHPENDNLRAFRFKKPDLQATN